MKRNSHLAMRTEVPEDIVLLPPDEAIDADMDLRHRREQSAANVRLFWQSRLFLGKALFYGLVAFTAIAFAIPSRYQSTARLMPPDQQSGEGLTMLASLAGKSSGAPEALSGLSGLVGDALGVKTTSDLFIGVLSSRTIQDELINKFDLKKVYGERKWEETRKKLTARTDLSTDRKSGIITITVTDRNPQRASAMTNEYIEQLNRVVTQLNTSTAHRERVFLEERLQQVEKNLEASERDFSQFASENVALDIPMQGKAMVEASAELQGELIGAQTELQGLRQIYSDNNVRVRSAQARIDELQRQLGNVGGGSSDGAKNQEQGTLGSIYPSLRRLPLLGVQYADLLRRNKIQEAVFGSLTQEYELAKVQEAKETPSVKVLDSADIPEKISFPPRLAIIFSGGFGVFFASCFFVTWRSRWEQRDFEDPTRVLMREISDELRGRCPALFPHLKTSSSRATSSGDRPISGAAKEEKADERR